MASGQDHPTQHGKMGGNAAQGAVILHRGQRYVVRFLQCDDRPWAVVCFDHWKPQPTLAGEFAGEGFFRDRGLNAIGIMAAENDWFQDDEILAALASIRAATPGWRLIGYGGSMGGYGAINFAHDLGLASLVAVVPQVSLDPAKTPYETRWRPEAARIDFRHDRIDRMPRLTQGWLIFDPWCVDGRHAEDIQKHHGLSELRVHFGGHAQMLMLQQAGLYTGILLDMLEERFDARAFRVSWRSARRQSAAYWLGLCQALLARGHAAAALRAILAARALPHPEPAWIDLTHADALAACGNMAEARRLAGLWADDAEFGPLAHEALRRYDAAAASLAARSPATAALPAGEPTSRRATWRRFRRLIARFTRRNGLRPAR